MKRSQERRQAATVPKGQNYVLGSCFPLLHPRLIPIGLHSSRYSSLRRVSTAALCSAVIECRMYPQESLFWFRRLWLRRLFHLWHPKQLKKAIGERGLRKRCQLSLCHGWKRYSGLQGWRVGGERWDLGQKWIKMGNDCCLVIWKKFNIWILMWEEATKTLDQLTARWMKVEGSERKKTEELRRKEVEVLWENVWRGTPVFRLAKEKTDKETSNFSNRTCSIQEKRLWKRGLYIKRRESSLSVYKPAVVREVEVWRGEGCQRATLWPAITKGQWCGYGNNLGKQLTLAIGMLNFVVSGNCHHLTKMEVLLWHNHV